MSDFIRICTAPFNLPITVMLLCALGYWVMFLVGAVGLDLFDADVDLDVDADVDLDLDVDPGVNVDAVGGDVANAEFDADIDGGNLETTGENLADAAGDSASSLWLSVLRFFNVGDVPVVVLYSGFACSLWALTVLSTHYFNPELSVTRSALWLPLNLIVSLMLTKITTSPFRVLFRQANLGIEKPTRFVGRTCIVTTSTVTTKFGQARIDPADGGAPIMLNVRAREGATIRKGDEALILEHEPDKRTFLVVPFDLGE